MMDTHHRGAEGNPLNDDTSIAAALWALLRHPLEPLLYRWNWKSAVTSALFRGLLFFSVNLRAGLDAAVAALTTELVFRFLTSGFYGAITEALHRARTARHATLTAMVLLPAVSHTLELVVHQQSGTSRLAESIATSMAFTALSTAFNLYAMRRGALLVGPGRRPLVDDLRRVPRLAAAFAAVPLLALWRSCRKSRLRCA